MKKFTLALLAAMALSVAAYAQDAADAADAPEAEEASAISATVSGEFLSAYLWKGQILNKDWVFQPDFFLSLPYNLSFELWATMDLTDSDTSCYPGTKGKWSEIDLALYYNLLSTGGWSLDVAGVYMTYPQDEPTEDYDLQVALSKEIAFTDSVSLTPALTFRHRLSNHDDWNLTAAIAPSWKICDDLSLGVDCQIGYGGSYFISHSYGSKDESAFTHAQAIAKLCYSVTPKFSVGIEGGYSTIIDSDLRDDMTAVDEEGNKPFDDVDCFFGGVCFSYDL